MDTREGSFKLFMLPWLAHGHISPFLELALRLAKRKFIVYLCSTPVNLEAIKPNIPESYSASIQLVEIHLDSTPELPPHYHTTKGLPPKLMPKLENAFKMAAPNLESILKSLNPNLLIADITLPWILPLSSSLNIPMVFYSVFGARAISCMANKTASNELRFPELQLHECWKSRCPYLFKDQSEAQSFLKYLDLSSAIILIKSSTEIEAKYLEFLTSSFTKKLVTTGPLLHQPSSGENEKNSEIIEWLDEKEPNSTVLVSFGSEYYLTAEEIEEIAHGLEMSGANFVWIVRFPMGQETAVEAAVPEGFIERTCERGKLVERWAPQAKILAHRSIGGHVSHCGWSSLMECLMFGVPVIGAPMQLDGPIVVRLVEEIGVGLEIRRDEAGKITRGEVAAAIKKVVMEKTGERFRRKVKEISRVLNAKDEQQIDTVAMELAKLCHISKGRA